MLPIFFIKFLFPCPLVCKPLMKHVLPDHLRGFLFNLIRDPHGYQYIGTSPFPDFVSLCQITHESKNIIVTERPRHHPQNIGVGHALFFSFIPSSELQTKKNRSLHRPLQLHGPGNSSIELLSLTSTQQQSVTPLVWMSVLISRQPSIRQKQTPQKIFPIPRKPQILKNKKFLESI